jgi:hypothetical protein
MRNFTEQTVFRKVFEHAQVKDGRPYAAARKSYADFHKFNYGLLYRFSQAICTITSIRNMKNFIRRFTLINADFC